MGGHAALENAPGLIDHMALAQVRLDREGPAILDDVEQALRPEPVEHLADPLAADAENLRQPMLAQLDAARQAPGPKHSGEDRVDIRFVHAAIIAVAH